MRLRYRAASKLLNSPVYRNRIFQFSASTAEVRSNETYSTSIYLKMSVCHRPNFHRRF